LDRLYAQIKQEKGWLDTIFVNVGGGTLLPLGAITGQQYNDTFDTNVKGVIFTVQKALPLLQDASTIVLNASTAASQGMGGFSVYAASKAAVRNLARGWATDLKERRIRVNVVSPAGSCAQTRYAQVPGCSAPAGTGPSARACDRPPFRRERVSRAVDFRGAGAAFPTDGIITRSSAS
jgi:NAD(P)-dependent dehydrogenase (short-subunit alcohol dehydrogenase family)